MKTSPEVQIGYGYVDDHIIPPPGDIIPARGDCLAQILPSPGDGERNRAALVPRGREDLLSSCLVRSSTLRDEAKVSHASFQR